MKPALWAIIVAAILLAVHIFRPRDDTAPHAAPFDRYNALLKEHGHGIPALLIDLDRLDHNIEVVRRYVRSPRSLRIVAKSLPSVPLLQYILQRAETRNLMVFHAPFVRILAKAFPDSNLLVGKPLPVAAARWFYQALDTGTTFDPARQLQWLIDDRRRLQQYADLAAALGVTLQVSLEIDVGLHRGGFPTPDALRTALDQIAADPHLQLSGLMGYDAHVAHAPAVISSVQRALAAVRERYRAFVEAVALHPARFDMNALTLNGAGSMTYQLYDPEDPLNDLAVGSGLLLPSDFDLPTIRDHQPALFVATPVLKHLPGTTIPYVEPLGRLLAWWQPAWQNTYFIYGGGWMAGYVSPAGLRDDPLYGFSTNQAIVHVSDRARLAVDDYVFLRPTQSEQVLLQFDELLAIRGTTLEARWQPFPRQ